MILRALLIIFVCCLGSLVASGQGVTRPVKGVVLEDGSNEPVPYAHVYVKRHASYQFYGAVSDLQGNFVLLLPTEFIDDTLHITSIGYDTRKIVLTPRGLSQQESILLKPQTTALPSVVIRDVSAGDFFKRSIASFRKNYLDVSFLNTAFYWQSIEENDTYKSLHEQHLVIRENNFGKDVRRVIHKDHTIATPRYYHYFDSVESLLYFDLIRSSSGVMNLAVNDEWDFSYHYDAKRAEHYVGISGIRKDNLAEVNVLIDDRRNAIEEVDFRYRWGQNHHSLNDTLLYRFTDVHGKILYNQNLTKYNLKYLYVTVSYEVFRKRYTKKLFSRTITHELVISTSAESYQPVGRESVAIDKIYLPTIVNLSSYCDAARALGKDKVICTAAP